MLNLVQNPEESQETAAEEKEAASEPKVQDDIHELHDVAEPEVKEPEGDTVPTEEHDGAPVVETQPEVLSEEHVTEEPEYAEEETGRIMF